MMLCVELLQGREQTGAEVSELPPQTVLSLGQCNVQPEAEIPSLSWAAYFYLPLLGELF